MNYFKNKKIKFPDLSQEHFKAIYQIIVVAITIGKDNTEDKLAVLANFVYGYIECFCKDINISTPILDSYYAQILELQESKTNKEIVEYYLNIISNLHTEYKLKTVSLLTSISSLEEEEKIKFSNLIRFVKEKL